MFEICDRIDARQLKAFSLYYLTKELDAVSQTEGFKNMSQDAHSQISRLKKPTTNPDQKKEKKDCIIQ